MNIIQINSLQALFSMIKPGIKGLLLVTASDGTVFFTYSTESNLGLGAYDALNKALELYEIKLKK